MAKLYFFTKLTNSYVYIEVKDSNLGYGNGFYQKLTEDEAKQKLDKLNQGVKYDFNFTKICNTEIKSKLL